MRTVTIETPYAADTAEASNTHATYRAAAFADAVARGEAPISAPDLFLTYTGHCLDSADKSDAKLAWEMAREWVDKADALAVYVDMGITPGMRWAIGRANKAGRPVEERTIPGWAS